MQFIPPLAEDGGFLAYFLLKEPKTFYELVKRLKEKGLIVNDEISCESFLSHVNYYNFTGYLLTFRDKSGERYKNVTFELAKDIFFFDKELRSIIFQQIESTELHLRTAISNYHALKYGADGYESSSNFNPTFDFDSFWDHVQGCIDDNSGSFVVMHHRKKYEGHFPLWVVVEFFSLGELSYLYRGMKYNDKTSISRSLYGVNPDYLNSWFRCLTSLRNMCAHSSRLYYNIFTSIPKLDNKLNEKTKRRLFAQLLMLKEMAPDTNEWNNNFLRRLEQLIDNYSDSIHLNCIGFPLDWYDQLKR